MGEGPPREARDELPGQPDGNQIRRARLRQQGSGGRRRQHRRWRLRMQLNPSCSTILLAALALPGLHTAARADTPPERGEITLSYLDYRDRQPGLDRVTVHAPGVSVMMPVAGAWTLE